MRRIAVVTCYRQPDYIRAIVLRQAVTTNGDEVVVIRNRSTGVRRYAEVVRQLLALRADRPDAYVVTFRAYEILPFVLLLAGRRPVVYDEFINPVEWFVQEHGKFGPSSLPAKALRGIFRWLMLRSKVVLTDTASHAAHSAKLMDVAADHFAVVPVGTDETTFTPLEPHQPATFRVLFYGSMLPLHGLDVLLSAMEQLSKREDIVADVVGGGPSERERVEAAIARGARVRYRQWVPYDELPTLFAETSLAIGGPLGGTVQSQFVITGKTYQFLASAVPTLVGANAESAAFTDGVNALVVPQAEPPALADRIRWAADNRDRLAQIGIEGRKLFEERWSLPYIARALGVALTGIRPHGEHAP